MSLTNLVVPFSNLQLKQPSFTRYLKALKQSQGGCTDVFYVMEYNVKISWTFLCLPHTLFQAFIPNLFKRLSNSFPGFRAHYYSTVHFVKKNKNKNYLKFFHRPQELIVVSRGIHSLKTSALK